jgi:hypothetical protein
VPDIIVRNRAGEIAWLVEVKTSQRGKAAVGAAILADICMISLFYALGLITGGVGGYDAGYVSFSLTSRHAEKE